MHMTREKIIFLIAATLILIVLSIMLTEFLHKNKINTCVLDFSKKDFFALKKKSYDKLSVFTLSKNPLSFLIIKHLIDTDTKIYPTPKFKKSFLFNFFNKRYKKSCLSFEEISYRNIKTVLKSMNTQIKSICICSKKADERLKNIANICLELTDKIIISTDDILFFDRLNSLFLKNQGIGLLYKNIAAVSDCDLVIILNEKRCDFHNKGRFVINLMKNHPVFGCNLLYDFYDKSCFEFEALPIKKANFIDEKAFFFKLQWKIMKKS